jgi:ubiquinone/menaquinone biosynthesis C-methylase UbiE
VTYRCHRNQSIAWLEKSMHGIDVRRTYYDHESVYRRLLGEGGTGWDDVASVANDDSYKGVKAFIASPFAAFLGEDRTALDLGCGGGQVALLLAKTGCVTAGVDYSPSAVSIAAANASKAGLNISFFEGDCLSLESVADRSFDVVTDNHIWHCIIGESDRRQFLRTAKRVLKKGGLIFSETMSREDNFSADDVGADPKTFISRGNCRYWVGYHEALEYFKSEGFELLHHELRQQPDEPGVGSLIVIYAKRCV